MRIAVIGSFAESLVNFRGPLLQAFRRLGHEVTAVSAPGPRIVTQRLAKWGIEHVTVPLNRTGLRPDWEVMTLRAVGRVLAERQPDRILAYTAKPVVYGALAARRLGMRDRFFAMITGLGYALGGEGGALLSGLARTAYRFALKGAAGFFFQNPTDREDFLRWGILGERGQSWLIPGSGVDLMHFRQEPLPEEPVFLMVARLLGAKGVREYARAAAAVRCRHPKARCLLVGWIDDHPDAISPQELESWVSNGTLEYLGRLEDVRTAYREALAVVLPSYAEGLPRTILEAMAMGRPVIATDVRGCRDVVQHGRTGMLVPPRDWRALAEAMESFIEKPELARRMGTEGRRAAVERFDVHKVNAKILAAMGIAAEAAD